MTGSALRFALGAAALAFAAPAAAAVECAHGEIAELLARFDRVQVGATDAAVVAAIFTETARVRAVSPAENFDRSRDEFAAQKVSAAGEPAPLAYAFEDPSITCAAEGAHVVRRGCQVMRSSGSLIELSQTEVIDLRRVDGALRIAAITSTLDAMRADGGELFRHKDFVSLPDCVSAARQ